MNPKDLELLKKKYPNNLEQVIKKIDEGYPIQYAIGNVEFLNTIINVDERVLIPRFETELLVDKLIKYIKGIFDKKVTIIDLGTGSGCIAIALKKNLDCDIVALDISKDAIELAHENALNNNVEISFVIGSIDNELPDTYDIIVSNPPYIALNGYVSDSVKKYEPSLALYAPDNGIYYYEQIISKHYNKLNIPGIIAFEIGDNEQSLLEDILLKHHISNYKFENDLTNRVRYLFIFNE